AAIVPEVVKDGVRLMEGAKRFVLDMNNTRFPAMKVDPNLPPLWPKLDPTRAGQVRTIRPRCMFRPPSSKTCRGFSSPAFSTRRSGPTGCLRWEGSWWPSEGAWPSDDGFARGVRRRAFAQAHRFRAHQPKRRRDDDRIPARRAAARGSNRRVLRTALSGAQGRRTGALCQEHERSRRPGVADLPRC